MNIHIGKNFKDLKNVRINDYYCNSCNSKTQLNLKIRGGVIVLFFIPMLPLKKDVILSCGNCETRVKKSSLNYIENDKVDNEFNSTIYKIPFYHFSGILITLAILAFAINTGIQIKKMEKEYVLKPLKNDIYLLKNDLGYTTYKVDNVNSDSIFIYKNNLIVNHYSQLENIDTNTNYKVRQGFKLSEIIKMYDSGIIYQINREE